ncbi:MAG: hypothetical protein DMG91_07145 [Acidobacteria bacterium]|nr:MAG: hypothetical protein DMG91_07145 [Acidobacteriota bacterium]
MLRPMVGIMNRSLVFIVLVFALTPAIVAGADCDSEVITPLILNVADAPIAFQGSDGRSHLVYELWITNFSSAEAALEKVDVLGDGSIIQSFDSAEIAGRLQPAGLRQSSGVLAKSTQALFLPIPAATRPGTPVPHCR